MTVSTTSIGGFTRGAPDYMIWSGDEKKEWCLKEPEALYDYIREECQ